MSNLYRAEISYGNMYSTDTVSTMKENSFRKHRMHPTEIDGKFQSNIKQAWSVTIGENENLNELYKSVIIWLAGIIHDSKMLFMYDLATEMKQKVLADIESNNKSAHWIMLYPMVSFELRLDIYENGKQLPNEKQVIDYNTATKSNYFMNTL